MAARENPEGAEVFSRKDFASALPILRDSTLSRGWVVAKSNCGLSLRDIMTQIVLTLQRNIVPQ